MSNEAKVIYTTSDKYGEIRVVEHAGERSLYLGSENKQSSMLIYSPFHLNLGYTRTMMAPLLFRKPPKRVLLLGLGGGSLAKYLYYKYPDCVIDVVELRKKVHRVAIDHFQLPLSARLRVNIVDIHKYLQQSSKQSAYDWIMIDAFNAEGLSSAVTSTDFLSQIHTLLDKQGIISLNLWSSEDHTCENIVSSLTHQFEHNVLKLPVDRNENNIYIAAKGDLLNTENSGLIDRAKTLSKETGIDFENYLETLKSNNNKSWLDNIFSAN